MNFQDNFFLNCLRPADLELLHPHLVRDDLQQGRILYDVHDMVKAVYFPVDSIVSLVVPLTDGHTVESAMVGRDGVVGVASALNGQIAFIRAIVQHSGKAFSCDGPTFKRVVSESATLASLMWRHENTLTAQASQSAACLSAHDVEARLCRWLLRSRDLRGSDGLNLTQEFLAEMLGVRRTSVTVAAQTLQRAGLITYSRGRVVIINLEGLREAACECYETVKKNYDILLGRKSNFDN